MRAGALGSLLRIAGVAFALVLLGVTARSAWREIAREAVPVDVARLALSLGLLCLAYLGFVALWKELFRVLGVGLAYRSMLRIWAFSNLGRYLPGKVWQVAGVAFLARDVGVGAGLATVAALLAMGLSVGTGALVSLALSPWTVVRLGPAGWLVPATAAGLLTVVAVPRLLERMIAAMPRVVEGLPAGCLRAVDRWRLTGLFTLGWVGHGLSFQVFCSAFGPVGAKGVAELTGNYALAYVAGLLALFAPGGIGVREGILGHLLGLSHPALPGHVIAVAARLWTIAAEIAVLALAIAARPSRPVARGGPAA